MPAVSVSRVPIALSPPQVLPRTSGLVFEPPEDRGAAALLLAPGAGTDMTSPVLRAVARRVAEDGHPAAVFNFPYTEAGRRPPDPVARLERAYRDVLADMRERVGTRPIVLGGRSMGGRMASHLAAQGESCAGLVLLGYPLHARPRVRKAEPVPDAPMRTGHWPALTVPMLFVTGDRDRLCGLDDLARAQSRHFAPGLARNHVIVGADHSFAVRARDPRTASEVLAEAAGAVSDWMTEVVLAPHDEADR